MTQIGIQEISENYISNIITLLNPSSVIQSKLLKMNSDISITFSIILFLMLKLADITPTHENEL